MNQQDLDAIAERVTARLQRLHFEGDDRFGPDRWQSVCEIGTRRGLFKSPYEDEFTRQLIECRPEVLYALAVNDGLLGKLAEMDEQEALQWLRDNADAIADELVDPEHLSAGGFREWKKRRAAKPAPGSMEEYVAERARRRGR
jgi:hypothetical protein